MPSPDIYFVLCATELQLRERRAVDSTRLRRNFEKHLRLVEPQRHYFNELQKHVPNRVRFVDIGSGENLFEAVRSMTAPPALSSQDSSDVLAAMTAFAPRNEQ